MANHTTPCTHPDIFKKPLIGPLAIPRQHSFVTFTYSSYPSISLKGVVRRKTKHSWYGNNVSKIRRGILCKKVVNMVKVHVIVKNAC